jgi:hypothetical protein
LDRLERTKPFEQVSCFIVWNKYPEYLSWIFVPVRLFVVPCSHSLSANWESLFYFKREAYAAPPNLTNLTNWTNSIRAKLLVLLVWLVFLGSFYEASETSCLPREQLFVVDVGLRFTKNTGKFLGYNWDNYNNDTNCEQLIQLKKTQFMYTKIVQQLAFGKSFPCKMNLQSKAL